jgi:hypothetical protein
VDSLEAGMLPGRTKHSRTRAAAVAEAGGARGASFSS